MNTMLAHVVSAITKDFIADCLRDPGLAASSDDFKAGYEAAMRTVADGIVTLCTEHPKVFNLDELMKVEL